MAKEELHAKSQTNSLQNYTQRLAARMTIEEALTGASRMLSAYPETAKDCSRDYLMTLAEALCQFPREVATQACSPIHGVPKERMSFRPTAGQVIEWCEWKTESIWEKAKMERPALPPPTMSEEEMAERKKHVDRVIGALASKKTSPKGWFDSLTVAEARRNLGMLDDDKLD